MAQNESDSEHSEYEELYEKSKTTNQSKGHSKSFVWDYFDKDKNDMSELTILNSVKEIINDTKDIVKVKEIDTSLEIIYKTINILVLIITIRMLEK
ncbi:3930_t:CDS:2, partial [Racocetra persica]